MKYHIVVGCFVLSEISRGMTTTFRTNFDDLDLVGVLSSRSTSSPLVMLEDSFEPTSPPLMSPRGRVIENFSPKQLSSVDQITARLMSSRLKQEHTIDEFTPQFDIDDMKESVPRFGILELDFIAYRSHQSVVFTVKNFPHIYVKYMHNCEKGRPGPHPLLSESWIQEQAARLGIAGRVFFVSPPALFPMNLERSRKTAFELNPVEQMECVLSESTVRFAVIERTIGRSVSSLYREGRLRGFQQGVIFGIHLIQAVEKLHSLNIVHGDLGIDRVAVMKNSSHNQTTDRIHFVNFGSAIRTGSDGVSSAPIRGSSHTRDFLKSPWELMDIAGGRVSKRDDLFRAVQIIARIMNPNHYLFNQERLVLNNNVAGLLRWKLSGNIFVPPSAISGMNSGPDPVMRLSISRVGKESIQKMLRETQLVVRICEPNPGSVVYKIVIFKLYQIFRLVETEEVMTTIAPTTSAPHESSKTTSRMSLRPQYSKRKREEY